jgi:hypothetical protein
MVYEDSSVVIAVSGGAWETYLFRDMILLFGSYTHRFF